MDKIEEIINTETPIVMWTQGMFGKTKMDEFREIINSRFNLKLNGYGQLYQWSIDCYDDFWEQFWHYSGIIHSSPYNNVIDRNKTIDEIPEWFSGAKLNYAENILEHPANHTDRIALYITGEGRDIETVTFGEMKKRVFALASAMKTIGIVSGDRIVGYLPNGREAVEGLLASSLLGAVWSSTSPDFGINGVLDRFRQIKPKLIFSVDAVIYNGKRHDHLEKLSQVIKSLEGLEKVVISPLRSDIQNGNNNPKEIDIPNSCTLNEFISSAINDTDKMSYVQVPFNHPLCILFSSGTTGEPKCLVHSVGGTLITHLREHILQGNIESTDIMMYYTTVGWMMWNWLVSALAAGASVVLYDGSPFYPTPNVIWDLIDKIGITILGTSAKGLQAMQDMGMCPKNSHKLDSLHTILSTGSPLKPQSFDYVYDSIKRNLLLGSITGGSDIIACFAGQNPTVPVHRGEIQSRNLGMAVECWDENGKPVLGIKGELVCTKPFPSMPIYLWNDPDGGKYKKAYFSQNKGVWTHGDFCLINPKTNGVLMLGRSDGTLNPNGVRFGSSEIYNIVETFKEIEDSVCVSQYSSLGEERVVLFLKMSNGCTFSDEIVANVKSEIRAKLSARHVPAVILEIQDIPYTINGKKIEVAVKMIISGRDVNNTNAIANPESLELYRNLSQLKNY